MLAKIWGIALLVFGVYLAYEVSHIKDPPTRKTVKANVDPQIKDQAPPTVSPASSEEIIEALDPATQNKVRLLPKSDQEISATVAEICEEMEDELKAAKITPSFAKIKLNFREDRLKSTLLRELASSCFRKNSSAELNLEIEIFSSSFGGQAKDQIQFQVSVFDKGFKNKQFEVGRKFEVVKVSTTPSSAHSSPSNP